MKSTDQPSNMSLCLAATPSEEALVRCALAKELEDKGEYEQARQALGHLWHRVGERPRTDELDEKAKGEVLLRAGALTGWFGNAHRIAGAQEIARELLNESASTFMALKMADKVHETQIEISWCYWREDEFNEAFTILSNTLYALKDDRSELKIVAALRMSKIESSLGRSRDSLRTITAELALAESSPNHALKGRYYLNYALGLSEFEYQFNDQVDIALIAYSAASFHLEQAGSVRFHATGENNLAYLLIRLGRTAEAEAHLNEAQRLFTASHDEPHLAITYDTRARLLISRGDLSEAKKVINHAIHILEKGDDYQAKLVESLITQGVVLARMSEKANAYTTLARAVEIAELIGDPVGASRALLTILEEVNDFLPHAKLLGIYERADQSLRNSRNNLELARLRKCARTLVAAVMDGHASCADTVVIVHSCQPDQRFLPESLSLMMQAQLYAANSEAVLIRCVAAHESGMRDLIEMMHRWSGRVGELVLVRCSMFREGTNFAATLKKSLTQAHNGTIVFEEVDVLNLKAQAVLQSAVCDEERFGQTDGVEAATMRARIIATCSNNLLEKVETGKFRSDLYYRLNVLEIDLASEWQAHASSG